MGPTVVKTSQESTSVLSGDGTANRRVRHHWIRWALLGVLGVVVIFVLVSIILTFEGRARPVSVKDAVSHYQPSARGETGVASRSRRLLIQRDRDGQPQPPAPFPVRGSHAARDSGAGANGCWDFHIAFSTNHWQSWTYCRRAAGLEEAGDRSGSAGWSVRRR